MNALLNLLNQLKIEQPEKAVGLFDLFYHELMKANEVTNLTGITGEEETEQKHFIDSLAAYPYLYEKYEKKTAEVLDIGAGAGFPSIPLAICLRRARFTAVESVGKKVNFLESAITALGLTSIKVLKCRVEELPKTKLYDYALARGVAELNTLCEYMLPFLKIGGTMIAYKGQKAEEEITAAQNALNVLGGIIEKKVSYRLTVKEKNFERVLIMIKKVKKTDEKYPRSGNKPRIKPL